MPGLVLEHGIGGIRLDWAELARWRAALLYGARRAGPTRWADQMAAADGPSIPFPNYSTLFCPPGGRGVGRLDPAELEILASFLQELIETRLGVENDAAVRRRFEVAQAQLAPQAQHQGLLDLTRRLVNVATVLLSIRLLRKSPWRLDPRLKVGQLAQVVRNLARSEPDAACTTLDEHVRAWVAESFADGRGGVVVHPVGTTVALELLHQHQGRVDRLIALGSPIALRLAVRPRLSPARTSNRAQSTTPTPRPPPHERVRSPTMAPW